MESPIPQEASDETYVAVWMKDLLELVKDTFVPNVIERLRNIQNDRCPLFALAASYRYGLHESQ